MISLWEYWALLTWEVDKGIFEGFCLPFSGTKGPPKGPRGSAMVLNGKTSVSWEVEIKYSTMGWFHYGITEQYSSDIWTKEFLMIWGIFLLFLGYEGPPKDPFGSPMTLNRQTSVPWEVEITYFTMVWNGIMNNQINEWNNWYMKVSLLFGQNSNIQTDWDGPRGFPMATPQG